jgi:hypothetical protein
MECVLLSLRSVPYLNVEFSCWCETGGFWSSTELVSSCFSQNRRIWWAAPSLVFSLSRPQTPMTLSSSVSEFCLRQATRKRRTWEGALLISCTHVCVNEVWPKHFQAGIFGFSHNAMLSALYWYETWSLIPMENYKQCLRSQCLIKYVDIRQRKWQEDGDLHNELH